MDILDENGLRADSMSCLGFRKSLRIRERSLTSSGEEIGASVFENEDESE